MTAIKLILLLGASPALVNLLPAQTSTPANRFKQLDADNDGKVSRAEAASVPWFDRLDANTDGFITLEEVRNRTPAPSPSAEPSEFPGEITAEHPVTLESCRAAADYSTKANGHAILVAIDGKTVYERYDNGWSHDQPHRLASGTKSFAGVTAAAAVHDRLFKFDDPVSDTITEWKDDPLKSKITIRQLLSLRSGIDPGDSGDVLPYSKAIQARAKHEPGTTFEYGPNPFQCFGELMHRKLADKDENYLDYLNARILEPIGIKYGDWRLTIDGDPHIPSGASITAREWVKFGNFLLDEGKVGDKQLIRKKLLAQLVQGSEARSNYGLTFWLPDGSDKLPSDRYQAAGAGKQRLTIIPSLNLVIVRFGETQGRQFDDSTFLSTLLK